MVCIWEESGWEVELLTMGLVVILEGIMEVIITVVTMADIMVAIEEEGRYLGLVSREDIEEALLYLHLLRHRAARTGGDAPGVHEPA